MTQIGPITPEGKIRSASNASRHSLMAEGVDLADESQAGWDSLLAGFVARFAPTAGLTFLAAQPPPGWV